MPRALVLLLAATVSLPACSSPSSQETSGPGTIRPKDLVAVEGPAPVGRFLVKAGEESLDSDLYEVRFSPPSYDRITENARVTTVAGCIDRIVVAAAQRKVGFVDKLQQLRGRELVPVDGLGLEDGSDPDVSSDCRILYVRLTGTQPQAIREIKRFDPATGTAVSVISGESVYGATWGPAGEVLVLQREPTGPKLLIIHPDGTRSELDPEVPDVGNTPWGKAGWVAMAVFSQPQQPPTGTLFLNPATGARSTLEGWLPLAWSPDGAELLVTDTKAGTTLAVVEVADLTRARPVGVSEVGQVWDAVWLPG